MRTQNVPSAFVPIQGFEATDYAWLGQRVVWVGDAAVVRHPRNFWQPWQPPAKTYSKALLQAGARLCQAQLALQPEVSGALNWLLKRPMPFLLDRAIERFDKVQETLRRQDLIGFEAAALRLLGLGSGLTPSGDDFVGGIFFALAHSPYPDWRVAMPALHARILKACQAATNPISAALLADNMAGASYGQLHDVLDALASNDRYFIHAASQSLLNVGSSSGADLLAGLLLALTTL